MMKLTKEQLARLTKEQKLELLDLIEEKKRRDKLRPNKYVPNAGQLPVHLSRAPNRFNFSSNAAGKTCLIANEVIWAAEGYNPILKEFTKVPCRIIVVLDQPVKVAESFLPELKKWTTITDEQLHKDGKPFISRISFPNGSSITFLFHDQDPLRAEGIEMDMVACDEPMPRPLFIALQRGGRTKGRKARYLFGGTPLAAPWLRTEIYEPWAKGERPDIECFRSSVEVNKDNLAEGYIEQFSKFLTEKEKRVRLHGEFEDLSGLALAHLIKRSKHIVTPDILREFKENQWPCVVALDPHTSKPTHGVMLGVAPGGQKYVLKELSRKQVPRAFAATLKEWSAGFRIIDWVCDSLGSADTTGGEGFKSFIEVLNEEGLRVRATTYEDKSDEAFIERIQEALYVDDKEGAEPKLKFVQTCTGTYTDIEQVQWVKIRHAEMYKPKLDISHKDFLACLKYALATNLRFDRSNDRIIKANGPVNWSERGNLSVKDRRFASKITKRHYTDGRRGTRDEEDF